MLRLWSLTQRMNFEVPALVLSSPPEGRQFSSGSHDAGPEDSEALSLIQIGQTWPRLSRPLARAVGGGSGSCGASGRATSTPSHSESLTFPSQAPCQGRSARARARDSADKDSATFPRYGGGSGGG